MSKKSNQPSEHDLEVWRNINQDLMDWLYSGLTGKIQLRGHQVVGHWSKKFVDFHFYHPFTQALSFVYVQRKE